MNTIQLKLSEQELLRIGFQARTFKDSMQHDRTVYELETINGKIYYNPSETTYKWYHSTIIGTGANDIHLDVTHIEELYTILTCFRIGFRYIK